MGRHSAWEVAHLFGRRGPFGGRSGPGGPEGADGGDGFGERFGFGRGFGGRRGNRVFDHGELRLVVLAMIAEQPRHGYEIIKEIEERLAGSYSPSPGVIYPTLTMLEELGHATVAEEGGKKRYAITAEGTEYLEANRAAVETAQSRMRDVNVMHGGGPAPQLLRAMHNFKMAYKMRQMRGPLTADQLRSVVEIIDNAAKAIENL
jgi:DNA-binding PadR family transcriptional regulator